jgi:1-deoxy-D-xylulose-5-phosphate reductoisomerase
MAKRIALLGATGSIGSSTLDLIRTHPERLTLHSISGFSQVARLADIANEFRVPRISVPNSEAQAELAKHLTYSADVLIGPQGLVELASDPEADLIMAAVLGAAGLPSTLAAAKAGKVIALANKESMVMSGQILMDAVKAGGATLLPVDSEHNAIYQSLPTGYTCGQPIAGLRQLWLTCSGGPFRNRPDLDLSTVTPAQAVAHPNWSMGQKISVDSASLMNKGLELIEACFLFDVPADQVQVVIHPQSTIHSLVEYQDGSFISQLGQTDMRIPIAHTLAWPDRMSSNTPPLDLTQLGQLLFEPVDHVRFPAISLARQAHQAGQEACIWFNAINECAVADFLSGALSFQKITQMVEQGLQAVPGVQISEIEQAMASDQAARRWYREAIQ